MIVHSRWHAFVLFPRLVMQKLSDVQAKKTRLGSEWCLFTISEAFECMCVFRVRNGLNNSTKAAKTSLSSLTLVFLAFSIHLFFQCQTEKTVIALVSL